MAGDGATPTAGDGATPIAGAGAGAGATRYVRAVGLQVADEAGYRRYREAIAPLLQQHGGRFLYDFVVSRVLISETEQPINRVFLISFGDRASADAFSADPAYIAIRRELFDPAVAAATQLATWQEPVPAQRTAP
jgi:uncharacterized protein (DUF1330 family)